MADLFREVDEALREDRAKTLWKTYGSLVIAVAVALVLGTAGYVFWEQYQTQQRQQKSADLAAALALAQENPGQAADELAAIATEGGDDHATLVRLYEAGIRAGAGDAAGAVGLYRQIAADQGVEAAWRDLARVLAVLHDLETGDPEALKAELAPVTAADSPYRFSARELTGLLALRQGDREQARTLFNELAEAEDAPAGVRARAGELAALLKE